MFKIRYTKVCLDAAEGVVPRDERGKRLIGIAVFESYVLEHILGRAHPITPILWFGPVMAYGIYVGLTRGPYGAWGTAGLFVVGWLVWTLCEYLLHRYLFHMKAETREERFRVFMMHGYHHEFPSDPTRLVAPIMMSWPLGIVLFTLWYVALGPVHGPVAMAGMSAGYVAYDWVHYYTHHFHPKGGVGKWLRSYHMLHHHDGDTRFGVSSPLWDFVFGTYKPLRKAARPDAV